MKLKDIVEDFDSAVNEEAAEEEVNVEETAKSDKEEVVDEEVEQDEVEETKEDEVEKSDEVEEVEKSDDDKEDKEETEEEKKKRKKKEKEEEEAKKKKDKEDKEDKEETEKSDEGEEEEVVEKSETEESLFKNEDMVGFLQNVLKSYESTRNELEAVKTELSEVKGMFETVEKSLEVGNIEKEEETSIEKSINSEEDVSEKAVETEPDSKEVDTVTKSEDGEDVNEGIAVKHATNVDNLEEATKSEAVSKSDEADEEVNLEDLFKSFENKFRRDINNRNISKNEQDQLRHAYIALKNGRTEDNLDIIANYLE